jgi:hypothetical protein
MSTVNAYASALAFLESEVPGIAFSSMTLDSVTTLASRLGWVEEVAPPASSRYLSVSINYFYGRRTETFNLDKEDEGMVMVFECISKFFESDRTKSKAAMFDILFENVSFFRKEDFFEYSVDSVKLNWSIRRMCQYIADDFEPWCGNAEEFLRNFCRYAKKHSQLFNVEELRNNLAFAIGIKTEEEFEQFIA